MLDVALVKVNLAGDVPALVLGDSDPITVGQEVLAMGYPITPNSGSRASSTRGFIMAKRTGDELDSLQIHAPVNAGNIGGPLVSIDGEVIGIFTSNLDELEEPSLRGSISVIGIDTAKRLLPSLKAGAGISTRATPSPTPVPISTEGLPVGKVL